ncbi:hypothetical protein BD626DRAFT_150328 [Schizophyllum amplum]|uniref:Uncharacterized protein n=1 Tax=Schizophyllum amplum TaxID=97359 RepID=A0A550C430_9AGAR|nr:hypothetical protein BD626DRAFT_150328 [Auriculariopsis ampla]
MAWIPRAVEPSLEAARLRKLCGAPRRMVGGWTKQCAAAVRRRSRGDQQAARRGSRHAGRSSSCRPTKEKEPVVVRKVEPVKKVDPTPPLAKKVEPAPAPSRRSSPSPRRARRLRRRPPRLLDAGEGHHCAATPIKAPPLRLRFLRHLCPRPRPRRRSVQHDSSTSTTLTTPAPSRQDSLDDLKHPINDSQGKATGKRVAFSAAVEADQRAAAEKKRRRRRGVGAPCWAPCLRPWAARRRRRQRVRRRGRRRRARMTL